MPDPPLPQVFSSLAAAHKLLVDEGLRPFLLLHPKALPDFAGLPTGQPNAVVVGLAKEAFSYENMNMWVGLLPDLCGQWQGCRFWGMGNEPKRWSAALMATRAAFPPTFSSSPLELL